MPKKILIQANDGEVYGTPIWYDLMPGFFDSETATDFIKKHQRHLAKFPKMELFPPHIPENPMKR